MSNETLKPCPFCKSEAILDKVDEGADYRPWFWYTVHCSNRDCVCANLCHEYETEAEAIAAWNTRVAKPCYATDYTHEHCKYSVNRGWVENAKLGSGTCEPNWVLQGETQTQEFWRCECGNCGECFGVEDRSSFPLKITIDEVDVPNFCPSCGIQIRKVVDKWQQEEK